MKQFFILIAIFIGIGGMTLTASAAQFRSDDSLTIKEPVRDDSFFSGQTVKIEAPVDGELFVAGNKVEILSKGFRSVFAAGNEVLATGGAGYNVFAFGNIVTIAGEIDHDVYAAGQTITIDKDSHIKGSVRIVGSRVALSGKIDGDVQISAQRVEIDAEIGGSLTGDMAELQFQGGKVNGDLKYRSAKDAEGLDLVTITGVTERTDLVRNTSRAQTQRWLLGLLTSLITGAAIIFLMPRKLQEITQEVYKSWFQSFLYGIVALLITPILFFLFITSVVAWPLAAIWVMIIIILLYLSYIMAHIIVGKVILDRIAPKQSNWWFSLILGLLLISLITRIPLIGGLLVVLIFFGATIPLLGATIHWWKNRLTA